MKCCPKCGSTDIVLRYGGRLGRLWLCRKCGYQDWFVVDFPDESLKKMKEKEKLRTLEKRMRDNPSR
ncbi:MAG: hypothetical protein HXS43_00985 [Theionarchaea archaeon]|nr:hypothetical protein [Theionarchaea archaeon]